MGATYTRQSSSNIVDGNVIEASDLNNEFNQTIGSLNQSMSYTIKQSLPVLKLNVPISVTSNKIFEVFMLISKQTSFEIIEMEQSIATAVNKEPFSLTKMLLKCLPFQGVITGNAKKGPIGSQSARDYSRQGMNDLIDDPSQVMESPSL